MSLFDVQGSYTGIKNLTLTLGVKNVFDTNPPATNQRISFQAGYDPQVYDARARASCTAASATRSNKKLDPRLEGPHGPFFFSMSMSMYFQKLLFCTSGRRYPTIHGYHMSVRMRCTLSFQGA